MTPEIDPLRTEGGLLHRLHLLLDEVPRLISDRVHLFTLELQRASRLLVRVVVLTLGAALFGATAWFALWITAGALAVRAGLPWAAVAIAIVAINAALTAAAVARLARLVPLLTLPATVRRLTMSHAAKAPEPATAEPPHGR